YGLGVLGLEIATKLYDHNGSSFSDGLINLGYQAVATTAKSVLTNLAVDEDAFSRLDIGIGDFIIPLRDGKFSWNIVDNIGNIATLFTYGRGFVDVLQGKATVRINKSTFSPIFTETKESWVGMDFDPNTNKWVDNPNATGTVSRMLRRAEGSFNQNGAIFISWNSVGDQSVLFHESLHSIFGRVAGRGNSWIDFVVFGSGYLPHSSRYFERVIAPFVNRVFPK